MAGLVRKVLVTGTAGLTGIRFFSIFTSLGFVWFGIHLAIFFFQLG